VENNSSSYLLKDALKIAQEHIESLEPPYPGYVWSTEFEQELNDAWLFAYKFHPVNPTTKEFTGNENVGLDQINSDDPFTGVSTVLADYPFIAGAFGFSVSKEDGLIKDWGAGKWSDIKQKGHINF
jgi:hypothetical protein